MKYSILVLVLSYLFLVPGCKEKKRQSNTSYNAGWTNLSLGNVTKTNLNAPAYQYPMIGNHGLILLADPYGFTRNRPSGALYNPGIYYSGWWKSNRYERANPFNISGRYNISGVLDTGKIQSFSQTLDITQGALITKLAFAANAGSFNSVRTQFVTADGVLIIKLEDDASSKFQFQISSQPGYLLKHTSLPSGITASTESLGQGHGAALSVVGLGPNVLTDTLNGIISMNLSPGKPAYLFIAAGGETVDGANYISKASHKASIASNSGYTQLRNANDTSYKAFWAKSSISIPEEDIMRKYVLSQYILKATLDNNPLPDGCFGPRKEGYDGSIGTECDAMFGWNAMLTANHANVSKVLPNWFENTVEKAKALAKDFYPNTHGVKWAWLSGYDGTETKNFQGKKADRLAYIGAFAAHISLLQAEYTCDDDRMRRGKEILEHAIQFQLDACVKEDGLWVNDGMTQGLPEPLRGEITEQASLLWSLKKAVALGVGPSSWGEEAKKIFIPTRYDSVQQKNIIVRYIGHKPSLGTKLNGYFLYLYGTPWVTLFLRAFDEHDPLLQPTYQAYIGDKDLTYTFSRGIAAANAAMMGYGQEALSMIKSMPIHNDLYYAEYEDQPRTTPEVGAHGSLMLGVQHMLFEGQSEKTIRVFPALPKVWENSNEGVTFSKLLANGAIEVSGKYSNSGVDVTLNNTSNKSITRTLLVRIPSAFTKITEENGTRIEGIVDDRFAKLTVSLSPRSQATYTLKGKYGSNWQSVDNSVAHYSQGWMSNYGSVASDSFANNYTNIPGSYCEYTFRGTAIRMIGQCGPDRGYVKVTIDGVNYGCYNLYASSSQPGKVLFEKYALKPGEHSIKWEATGKRIQVSKDAYVDLDKIEVLNSVENPDKK